MPSPESLLIRKHGVASDAQWQVKQSSISRMKTHLLAYRCLFIFLSLLGFVAISILRSLHLPSVISVDGEQKIPCDCIDLDEALMRSFPKEEMEGGRVRASRKELGVVASHTDGFKEKDDSIPRKLLGFVGIQTTYSSMELRKVIRETWLASDPEGLFRLERGTGLVFRFVIGKTNDSKKMNTLDKEMKKYNDVLLIDYEEANVSSAKKTLTFLTAAILLFDAEFYVKAEENIYLRPDRLSTILAKDRSASRTYLGCMKNGPVIKDPKSNWYEPQSHILGNDYFYHAHGSIYALSMEIVEMLLSASNESFRFFANEDITIGSWMLSINVNHEDNKNLCDTKCTSKSIAVVDLPRCIGSCNTTAVKVQKLHEIEMCSRSPTLPADSDDLIV